MHDAFDFKLTKNKDKLNWNGLEDFKKFSLIFRMIAFV